MEYTGYSGPKKPGFVFGGDTGISHGQLQTKRRIAEAMAANMAGRTPQNIGEGLSAIGDALRYRKLMNQIDKGEAQGQSKAYELISAALQGREPKPYASSTGPMTMFGLQPPARTPEQVIGDDTMAVLGKDDAMSNEGRILKGLNDRGLPEHIAQGFVDNFRDESGLNPGINEQNPIVPGSRGGYGLAQWTGPRRKQLEAFAQEQGKPVSDLDLQLDFLMTELQGSESAAGRTILSTKNRGDAAAAIVNDFLRPAEEHRARREAQYRGATPEPQRGDYSAFYQAFSSPWVSQEQKAMLMAEMEDRRAADDRAYNRWLQTNDPMRQLQLQKAELELERMQNPQPGFMLLTDAQEAEMGLDTSKSYQRGADGKISAIGGGGTHVNVTTGGGELDRYLYGSDAGLPQGWRYDRQAEQAEPIPGGPAALEAQAAAEAGENANEAKTTSANIVLDEIGIAKELIGGQSTFSPATGITGKAASLIDNTRAGAVKNRLTTIKANIGFDKLQSMRDASPTGGALGQVSQFENLLLQAVFGSLEQAQSEHDLLYNLNRLEGIYNRVIHEGIPDDEARELYRQIQLGGHSGAEQDSQPPADNAPQVGTVEDGYRFLGGDPADANNWEQVN